MWTYLLAVVGSCRVTEFYKIENNYFITVFVVITIRVAAGRFLLAHSCFFRKLLTNGCMYLNTIVRAFIPLACIIHEDSTSRFNSVKQVAQSPEKRGSPRAEGD